MVWGLGALPILLVFLLFDLGWWSAVLSRKMPKWAVLTSSIAWAIAVVVDFSHH